jgi:hypothetical protein
MASQQWRRLPNAYPYCDSHGDRDTNCDSHGNCDSYSDSYGYADSDCNSDANTLGDPASADAKTAAYAVSSADAVSE